MFSILKFLIIFFHVVFFFLSNYKLHLPLVSRSVENAKVMHRIDLLRKTRARVKFLSCEPLIGPLPQMNLEGIDWVIVGGESGRRPRPMKVDWVLDIQQQCEAAGVKFFFKQWGGTNKKKTGRELNGRTYDEMPGIQG